MMNSALADCERAVAATGANAALPGPPAPPPPSASVPLVRDLHLSAQFIEVGLDPDMGGFHKVLNLRKPTMPGNIPNWRLERALLLGQKAKAYLLGTATGNDVEKPPPPSGDAVPPALFFVALRGQSMVTPAGIYKDKLSWEEIVGDANSRAVGATFASAAEVWTYANEATTLEVAKCFGWYESRA